MVALAIPNTTLIVLRVSHLFHDYALTDSVNVKHTIIIAFFFFVSLFLGLLLVHYN